MAASVAVAGGIQRPGVVAVARIAYLDVAEAREKPAIARIAGGHDAIEHVHAPAYALDQIFGRAHAHQVAGCFRRQARRYMSPDAHHVLDRKSTRLNSSH